VPSAKDIDTLLKQAEGILRELKLKAEILKEPPDAAQIKALEDGVDKFKKEKIALKDGVVDETDWNAKTEDKKVELYEEIRRIARHSRCLNMNEIAVGRCYFVVFSVILVVLAGIYLVWHHFSPKVRIVDDKVIAAAGLLNKMSTHIKGLQAQPPAQDAKTKLKDLGSQLRTQLQGITLTFPSSRLLGEVLAEVETDQIAKTETFENFRKIFEPELESLSSGYFWTDTPRRWFEIAFWAEFGTLVGLLFYIAGLLSTGVFRIEEISMFWTEVLITPLVVTVVFFLFTYTGITVFQPSEVSMTVNVGFAFIFGFAIRRTVGFLDIIKKRFFPEPAPVGKAAP
jgi:hypothetical protein